MYGKFAGIRRLHLSTTTRTLKAGWDHSYRANPVIDPDNRSFPNWNNLVNFDVGIGFRIFFNRWLAAIIEVRDLIYSEKIESLVISPTDPTNPNTWYDTGTHLTNDVQLQVGLSFFLPTSFEYRLPK